MYGDQLACKAKTTSYLVIKKKNGVATAYRSRDPKRRVLEKQSSKIALVTNASDPSRGLYDARTNYLGRLEYPSSLAPVVFEKLRK